MIALFLGSLIGSAFGRLLLWPQLRWGGVVLGAVIGTAMVLELSVSAGERPLWRLGVVALAGGALGWPTGRLMTWIQGTE